MSLHPIFENILESHGMRRADHEDYAGMKDNDDAVIAFLRAALESLRDCHLGDCPTVLEEIGFAHNHIIRLRRMAADALGSPAGKP